MASSRPARDRPLLGPGEEEAIRAAVAAAERGSGAEVVAWIVAACDPIPRGRGRVPRPARW
jgi:hypothetical protein